MSLLGTHVLRSRALADKARRRARLRLYIDPANSKKVAWDVWVGFLILYSVVVIPWRIAYEQRAEGGVLVFEIVQDICFGIDMLLSLVTAYVQEDVLVTSNSKIASRYLRTWFFPDLVSTIPIDRMIASGGDIRSLKLIRAVRLFRLLKLMRILRLGRKLRSAEISQYLNPASVRLIKLMCKILFVAHLISCVWFLVNDCSIDGGDDDWLHCGGASQGSKYLASFYWTITTLMSVGYGDISADTNAERMYALVTEVIGATAFGFIIAMVTVIVETMDPQATAKAEKMDEIREYMAERQLPKELQRKIRRHFDYQYSSLSVFKEVPILQDLPHSLRIKLAYETHKETIRTLHIFSSLDVLTITEVVHRLKPMSTVAGEIIMRANDVLEECFFVAKGNVEGSISGKAAEGNVLVAVFRTGSEFELAGLVGASRCALTYRTPMNSSLLWLNEDDVSHLMGEYLSAERSLLTRAALQAARLKEALASPTSTWRGRQVKGTLLVDWEPTAQDALDEELDEHMELDKNGEGSVRREAIVRTLRVAPRGGRSFIAMRMAEKNTSGDDSDQQQSHKNHSHELQLFPWGAPETVCESVESTREIGMRGIILPTDSYKIRWDLYIGVLIALSVIIVPYRLGFDVRPKGGWVAVDIITDACFALDILLSFRTAYLDDNNVFVTVPRLIAGRYARGWLLVDVLSTVPFDRIAGSMTAEDSGALRGLKLIRVLRMIRLFRLVKLMKIINVNGVADELIEINALVFRGLRLLLTLAFLGHLFGCFWSMVSVETMIAVDDTWWGSIGLEPDQVGSRYIASIYWAFTTMTTVGYGDIYPAMDSERAYATAIMVIGATVFGYIVGSVSALASNPNGSQARETEKLIAVTNYLDEKKVRHNLRSAVRKHIEYYMSRRSAFDEQKILSSMSPQLRVSAILQGHRDVIHKLALFKHQTSSFTAYIVRRMMPFYSIAEHNIYSPEEGSDGIYFILSGTTESYAISESGDAVRGHLVEAGKFFGHDLFLGFTSEKLGARAVTDCSLYVLLENEMIRMVDRQPEMATQLQKALKRAIFEQETDDNQKGGGAAATGGASPGRRRQSVMGLMKRISHVPLQGDQGSSKVVPTMHDTEVQGDLI